MNEALLSAVQEKTAWLERFTRTEYAKAVQDYKTRYGAAVRTAIRDADGNPDALASALCDALSAGWKREAFWKRTSRRFDEKRMIFLYLSPMLLEIGEGDFARTLQAEWARRYPKDAYKIVPWEKLQSGFRLTIMGFEVPRHDEEE